MILIGLFVFFFALTTINAQSTIIPTTNSETPSPPDVTNHPNLRLLDPMCGPITLRFTEQTVGNKTGIFDFAWMARLMYYITGETNLVSRCSGTIISSRYILTVAHCVTSLPSNIRLVSVRVGDHDISTERDCDRDEAGLELECAERYQEFGVESVHYHPQFTRRKKLNDIALIRLNSSVDFRPLNVKSICLPYGSAANFTQKKATVSGWGMKPFGEQSQVLLQEKLSVIPHEQCKEIYEQIVNISHKQLCAANSCVGEGGGPLQAPGIYNGRAVRTVQYGVISTGLGPCGIDGPPELYTNVAYYMDWILDTMTD